MEITHAEKCQLNAAGDFCGTVATVASNMDCNKAVEMASVFPNPDRYIEHPNDLGGMRAFLLAVSRKCVEILEAMEATK